ncbi:hypothetical protein ACTXT7_004956 [Hymenolepis weldensis]
MCRRLSLGVMMDTRLDIYVQTRKHTEGPPISTEVATPISRKTNYVDMQNVSVISRHRCLVVLIGISLVIYVQTSTRTAVPPVDIVMTDSQFSSKH